MNEETQSPEAGVIEGGINYNHATIRLTSVQDGRWACDVLVSTKPSLAAPAIEVTVRQLLGLRNVRM